MNTSRSTFRLGFLNPLFAGAIVALIVFADSAQADTFYFIQVQAGTNEVGSAAAGVNYLYTTPGLASVNPETQTAGFDGAVGPILGCCSGSYAVGASATPTHGGTAFARAAGDGGFAGSTLPRDNLANPPIITGFAQSNSSVTSFFQLVGPGSSTPIGVNFDWAMSASSTGAGSAFADLIVYRTESGTNRNIFAFDSGRLTSGQAGAQQVINMLPNTTYVMIASAGAAESSTPYGAPFGFGSGSAFADPLFSLPAAYQGTYNFVGLPTAAVAAVPERSVMILLTAGLAIVGFKSRAKGASARRA